MKICDDQNLCTTDHLVLITPTQRACLHLPKSCDDQNKCTIDHCDPTLGCVYQPVTCADNFLCTIETCTPAHGCRRFWKLCADGDRCTDDVCEPTTGDCLHTVADCDDADPCTLDSCQPLKGCVHEPGGCESPYFDNLATSVLVLMVHDPEDPAKVLAPCEQKKVLLGGKYTEVPAGFVQQTEWTMPPAGVPLCFDPYISTCTNEPAPLKQAVGLDFVVQAVPWLAHWSVFTQTGEEVGVVYAKDGDNATPPYYFPGVEFTGLDPNGVSDCTYSFAVYICPNYLKTYSCPD